MNIQCTQRLLDKLKLPAVLPTEQTAFLDWHASYLLINRHHTVLMLNNLCRYALVFHGLKAADFKKIPHYFQQALTEVLLAEDVDQATIDQYLALAGTIHFTKTGDRSITAQMAQTGQVLPGYAEEFDQNQIVQTDFNLSFGAYMQKIGPDYYNPRDLLRSAMTRFKQTGQTQFTTTEMKLKTPAQEKAFVLSVQLPCGDRSIWRKLAVPAICTFDQLHRIIQISFNWQGEHLHQFQVFAANGDIVAQSQTEVDDDPGFFMRKLLDIFTDNKRLSAFLPQYRSIRYLYDFGDDWSHSIKLEETIKTFTGHLPCCLDGEGTAPPEDVGGEGGYLEFLSIVENEADTAEKREMLEWAASLKWRQFDLQEINKRLSWLC